MLFRPEEIHGTSGIGDVVEPLPEWYGCIPHYALGFNLLEDTIFDLHPEGRTTIQARSINLY